MSGMLWGSRFGGPLALSGPCWCGWAWGFGAQQLGAILSPGRMFIRMLGGRACQGLVPSGTGQCLRWHPGAGVHPGTGGGGGCLAGLASWVQVGLWCPGSGSLAWGGHHAWEFCVLTAHPCVGGGLPAPVLW